MIRVLYRWLTRGEARHIKAGEPGDTGQRRRLNDEFLETVRTHRQALAEVAEVTHPGPAVVGQQQQRACTPKEAAS